MNSNDDQIESNRREPSLPPVSAPFYGAAARAAAYEKKGHQGYGLIQLFTGDGKGKTTAALGELMRAVGAGKRVVILFFDKGGEHYFERSALETLGVDWFAFGRDRIESSGRFDFSITDEDRARAERGIAKIESLFNQEYDLIVLDEINSCAHLGMLEPAQVVSILKQKPGNLELILTGRNAPDEFVELAHLVTEMKLKKHYFYSGVKAREGLDY